MTLDVDIEKQVTKLNPIDNVMIHKTKKVAVTLPLPKLKKIKPYEQSLGAVHLHTAAAVCTSKLVIYFHSRNTLSHPAK